MGSSTFFFSFLCIFCARLNCLCCSSPAAFSFLLFLAIVFLSMRHTTEVPAKKIFGFCCFCPLADSNRHGLTRVDCGCLFELGGLTGVRFVVIRNQLLFSVVAERFDSSFSSHGIATAVKLLDIHQLFRFVYSGVSGSSSPLVHFNAPFHVFCVSSVEAAILAAKNVNIVGQSSSLRG